MASQMVMGALFKHCLEDPVAGLMAVGALFKHCYKKLVGGLMVIGPLCSSLLGGSGGRSDGSRSTLFKPC